MFFHGGAAGRSVHDQYGVALAENTRLQFAEIGELQADEQTILSYAQKKSWVRVGEIVFKTNCISCHGRKGEGKVGPNLTDEHYKHVQSVEDIAKVISNGAAANAMPAWSNRLHPNEVVLVSAYVASIRGNEVEGGKPPEGKTIAPWPNLKPASENESSTDQGDRMMLPVLDDSKSKRECGSTACEGKCGKAEGPLLSAPEHVLSTLQQDGSRRWIHPRLAIGPLWRFRRVVAYVLMAVFVLVPHIPINGKPMVLLDIAAREFTILGQTFLPTDTMLLALLLLSVFLTIVLVTAVSGRAWCGWACPQTVYMEFLFRPIDRLLFGTVGKGGRPKGDTPAWKHVVRLAIYVLLSMFLAHTFLAYFVGTQRLAEWVQSSPIEHPIAFLVMAGTTALMLFDFLFFREQLCLIACPYGRFQSVMLDQHSLIVGYDHARGEPRRKGKRQGGDTSGDCVDCNQCVVVCPTGIDIRDGLQMECINCTQCIDACNSVMDRVGSPKGLIRFTSQNALANKTHSTIRTRTILYPILLAIVLSGLAYGVHLKSSFDARVLRGKGAPFTIDPSGSVTNRFRIRLVNRSSTAQQYRFVLTDPNLQLEVIDESGLSLDDGETSLVPIAVRFPPQLTSGDGNEQVRLRINDGAANEKEIRFRILGPRQ